VGLIPPTFSGPRLFAKGCMRWTRWVRFAKFVRAGRGHADRPQASAALQNFPFPSAFPSNPPSPEAGRPATRFDAASPRSQGTGVITRRPLCARRAPRVYPSDRVFPSTTSVVSCRRCRGLQRRAPSGSRPIGARRPRSGPATCRGRHGARPSSSSEGVGASTNARGDDHTGGPP
jgi:hypothetical protein